MGRLEDRASLVIAVFVKNGPLYTVAHTNISGATPEAICLSPVGRGETSCPTVPPNETTQLGL